MYFSVFVSLFSSEYFGIEDAHSFKVTDFYFVLQNTIVERQNFEALAFLLQRQGPKSSRKENNLGAISINVNKNKPFCLDLRKWSKG